MTTTSSPAPARDQEHSAARLYETYGRQLYRFCLARMRSREEAEDAVQSTFLRAHAALQKGVVPRFEAAWLYKIAHNVCTTRREALGRRTLLEELPGTETLERAPGPEPPSREDLRALAEAVAELPENQRRAILLREWRGLSYAEIAGELGITGSAVETLVFRARRRLAGELELRGARPRHVLDLGAALAALRGLLARLGEAVPAKMAAGAALVAVGGAGVGVGVAVSDSKPAPARATGSVPAATRPPATSAPAAAAPGTSAPAAASTPARSAPAAPRRSRPAPAATARAPVAPASAPAPTAAASATTAAPGRGTAPSTPAATTTAPAPVPPAALPPAPALAIPTLATPTLATPEASLPTVPVEPPTVPAAVDPGAATVPTPEPPQLPVSTPALPLP